jgi:hypothetical protein
MKAWLEQTDERITSITEELIRVQHLNTQQMAQLQTDMDAKLVKEMEIIEFNCNSNTGEMISAAIEELSASTKAAGGGFHPASICQSLFLFNVLCCYP